MTFLNPTYLWGLLGLAIPLAIHLWSKKEGKTIKIGSIQLLAEANPKQASSIHLNELFLLFLRLLIIALLAFILAAPQLKRASEFPDLVYLIEPALLKNTEIRAMLDSLPEGSIHLLEPEFPAWERNNPLQNTEDVPNYWQLGQEMKNLQADSIVVFTRALFRGVHGKRPTTTANTNWVIMNPEIVQNQMILAEKRGDSILLISVNSDSNQLTFNTEKISQNSREIDPKGDSISLRRNGKPLSLLLNIQDTLYVQISASDSLIVEKIYIESSFKALSIYIDKPLNISEVGDSVNGKSNVLVWLKDEPLPKTSIQILTYKLDILTQDLISPTGIRNVFHLTQHLNSENVISENLPEQLLTLLELHPDLENKIGPYDLRSISKNELQMPPTDSEKIQNYVQSIDLSPWFWLAFILIFITERITAFYRKQ